MNMMERLQKQHAREKAAEEIIKTARVLLASLCADTQEYDPQHVDLAFRYANFFETYADKRRQAATQQDGASN